MSLSRLRRLKGQEEGRRMSRGLTKDGLQAIELQDGGRATRGISGRVRGM